MNEPLRPGSIRSVTNRRLNGLNKFWILPIQFRWPFPETRLVRTGSNRWKNNAATGSKSNGVRSDITRGKIHSGVSERPGKTIGGLVGSKLEEPIETEWVCNVCCIWSIMNPKPVKSKQRTQLVLPWRA